MHVIQLKVVPVGAKNGNAAFQRTMEDLIGPVRDFVDDIIIGSGTEDMTEDELIEAHEKDLRQVLSELDEHNMVCKPTKASLFVRKWSLRVTWLVTGNAVPCLGSWRPCTTGRSPRPSGNSDPSWGSAITIRAMSGCMQNFRARCTRCCRWASSMVGRGARRSLPGPLRPKMRSAA